MIYGRQTLVLRLRERAGFGDLLYQIDVLFAYCEKNRLNPQISISNIGVRNELKTEELLSLCNLKDNLVRKESSIGSDIIPFSRLLSQAVDLNTKSDEIFCSFDMESYRAASVHLGPIETHPHLINLAKQSDLYFNVKQARDVKVKERVCIHIRRGDVARIQARLIQNLLKDDVDPNLILHVTGLLKPEEIETKIEQGNRNRFASIGEYLHTLEKQTNKRKGNVEIVLVSDGMTKLAESLKNHHPDIFKNEDISVADIESALELELEPLISKSERTIIGERNTLIDTIKEGLTSDIIIFRSGGFLQKIANIFELEIPFIYVNDLIQTQRRQS